MIKYLPLILLLGGCATKPATEDHASMAYVAALEAKVDTLEEKTKRLHELLSLNSVLIQSAMKRELVLCGIVDDMLKRENGNLTVKEWSEEKP